MIPILSAEQTRAADQYTIKNEPIASIDLMERASMAFAREFMKRFDSNHRVFVMAGIGNNGGDGLAISRLLESKGYSVQVYAIGELEKASPDFLVNYQRLGMDVIWLTDAQSIPITHSQDILIDALFGSGLTRPLKGLYQQVVESLNRMPCIKVSVDIASGLMADKLPEEGDMIFQPDLTFTFQCPKLTFFQPSTANYVGEFKVLDIGLDLSYLSGEESERQLTTFDDLGLLSAPRHRFSNKGDYGRLQLIGGSKGKIGSICLSSLAAMRSGAGLLFSTVPECGIDIIQQSVPEAMVHPGLGNEFLTKINVIEGAGVIGIGPGLGTSHDTMTAFDKLLDLIKPDQKLVLDADAINILAQKLDWLSRLPEDSILTPHPGEFARLVGEWRDDFEKLSKLREFCTEHRVHVVLKGAYSAVCDKSGRIAFNPTGNAGMATAGSGDVLLGIIAGLLSTTGLSPLDALKAGVYVHGLAGDIAAQRQGERSLIASDIIEALPEAFQKISKQRKI